MEWSNWLQTSDIVPSFLTPGGSDDMLPAPIGKDSCRLQVGGPAIGQDSLLSQLYQRSSHSGDGFSL